MNGSNVYNFSTSEFDEKGQELAELLFKAKTGDNSAFGQLYDLFFQRIYRFVYYRVGHKEIAEDLTEEVFIKALSKLHRLNDTELFESWLYQIARNAIIDHYRSKKQLVNLQEVENTLEYDTNIVDLVNLQFQQATLIKLLKELGDEQQAVIKMKFLEDLSNAHIAEILNKTEGAIRVIQHRALNRLIALKQKHEAQDK